MLRRLIRRRRCRHAWALEHTGVVTGTRVIAYIERCVFCGKRIAKEVRP